MRAKTKSVLVLALVLLCAVAWVGPALAQKDEKPTATVGTWDDAVALFEQARAAYQAARYGEAIGLYEQALVIVRALGERRAEAAILNNLGLCYRALGDYRRAIGLYEQALAIRVDIGDRPNEAKSLNNLGNCYYALGDYRRAIELYEQALAIERELQNRLGEAGSLSNLGVCYESLGDYRRAIELHVESLAIFVDIGDRPGEAQSLNNLGNRYYALGDYRQAIELHEESLAIKREIGDRPGEAISLNNLGVCYLSLGDYRRAIELYEQALAIFVDIGDRSGEASSLNNLGNCYLSLGDYRRAIGYFEDCLLVVEAIAAAEGYATGAPETLWRLRNNLALSHRALGDLSSAASSWTHAVDVVETLRGRLGDPAWLASFMREKFTLYHDLVTTLATLDQPGEALFYAERAKARTLVDMMDMAMALRRDELPPELQEPAELVVALGALEAGAADPLAAAPVAEVRTGADRAALLTREAFDEIYRRIREENEVLSTLLAVNPAQIQTYMKGVQEGLGEETVALEYFVTRDEILLWVITRDGIQAVHRIPITRAELALKVRAFREAMDEEVNAPPELKESGRAARLQRVLELGQELYAILLVPVEPYLEGAMHLVVIPSDVLFYVPFAALVRCPGCVGGQLFWEGEYLIERHTVSYGPSLASLYWPLERRQEATSYTSALVVGNPTLDLSYAEDEARAVAALFPMGEILLREEGTKDALLGLLTTTHYDVVHLSTHGLFDREVALGSGVELAHKELLTAVEILGLRLPAQLAVLSACQTALPPDVEESLVVGDELQGLSQALFVAGVPSSVLTLWDVNDRSTSELMAGEAGMYGHLLRGETRAEALRRAQRALMGDPTTVYCHPYYWAAFVLYGDWR